MASKKYNKGGKVPKEATTKKTKEGTVQKYTTKTGDVVVKKFDTKGNIKMKAVLPASERPRVVSGYTGSAMGKKAADKAMTQAIKTKAKVTTYGTNKPTVKAGQKAPIVNTGSVADKYKVGMSSKEAMQRAKNTVNKPSGSSAPSKGTVSKPSSPAAKKNAPVVAKKPAASVKKQGTIIPGVNYPGGKQVSAEDQAMTTKMETKKLDLSSKPGVITSSPVATSSKGESKGILAKVKENIRERRKERVQKKLEKLSGEETATMKKGGKMSCSCGKGSCSKCGGKKMQDGGKKKPAKQTTSIKNVKKPVPSYFPESKPKSLKQLKKEMEKRKGLPVLKEGGTHRGFKAVQKEIAKKQGVSMKSAGAILASAGRKASPAAKKANPRLLKIKGNKK